MRMAQDAVGSLAHLPRPKTSTLPLAGNYFPQAMTPIPLALCTAMCCMCAASHETAASARTEVKWMCALHRLLRICFERLPQESVVGHKPTPVGFQTHAGRPHRLSRPTP